MINRIFGLDLMRFTAISFVLIGHGWLFLGDIGQFSANIKNILVFGVEIFFVLSGFLIGGILIKDFEKSFKFHDICHFWKRRWFRTLPNYLLFLLINYIGFSILTDNYSWNWQYLFFLQNFAWMQDGFFSVSWSLAIEEWFYLLTPLAIYSLKFLPIKRAVLFVIIVTIILITSLRLYGSIYNGYLWNEELRLVTIYRLDSLMYGVLAAWFSYYYNHIFLSKKTKALIISFIGITTSIYIRNSELVITSPIASALFFPLSCFSFMFLLPTLSNWRLNSQNYLAKFITLISAWSYSLYLVHVPTLEVLKIMAKKFPVMYQSPFNIIIFLSWLSFSILASYIIFTFFEKPMMNMRDKPWFPIKK